MLSSEAYSYAAMWGSYMRDGDPGACMYGFDFDCRPQSEEHRQKCLSWIDKQCLPVVEARPDDFDDDEAETLGRLRAYLADAPLAEYPRAKPTH